MNTKGKTGVLWRLTKSLRRVLTHSEKKKSLALFFLIVSNSFVELIGLATIIPVVGAVVDPTGSESQLIANLRAFMELSFGSMGDKTFIQSLVVFMVLGFGFKALYGMALTFIQTRFVYSIAYRLKSVLWSWHFSRSLERMRTKDSGALMSEITFWPAQYVNGTLLALVSLLNDVFVLVLIVIGLIAYDVMIFSSVLLLCVAGSLMIRLFTKARMERYSEIRRMVDPRMNTTLNNAIRGILELLAFSAVDTVKEKYLRDAKLGFRVMSNSAVLSSFPARLYELLAAVSVALAVVLFLFLGKDEGVLESLTFLALASYRIMPALSRINQKLMGLRGNAYLIDWMDATQKSMTVEQWEAGAASEMSFVPSLLSLEVEDLSLEYETLTEPVIEGLNFKFEAGKVSSIVGPSGCGKSTLLNALLGLHKPVKGRVKGHSNASPVYCSEQHLNAWLSQMAYLPQHPYLFNGTVRENLNLGIAAVSDDLHLELMARLDMTSALGNEGLDMMLNEGGSNLSGGQQQRLALMRAFGMEQSVLILDEATSALDVQARDKVMTMLKEFAEQGRIVILVTHDREIAGQCDAILDLEKHNLKS